MPPCRVVLVRLLLEQRDQSAESSLRAGFEPVLVRLFSRTPVVSYPSLVHNVQRIESISTLRNQRPDNQKGACQY